MNLKRTATVALLVAVAAGCGVGGGGGQRGIADRRSDFGKFLPMTGDAARDGLKPVRPFFKRADRGEILRAIERACVGSKAGSSVYEPRMQAGYYVNCNPENRQLLNGFVPLDAHRRPHSRE